MIIIINGALGVGKTSVAEELHWKFRKSVHLDGDAIGNVNPFEIYDDARTLHFHRTLALLVGFHQEHGYPDFVINYIFENAGQLEQLTELLRPLDPDLHSFRLVCEASELEARVRRRNRDTLDWELKRSPELARIQDEAAEKGFIGKPFDTTGLSAAQSAEEIWRLITGNDETET
jgi:broad-specificity NMP kinase